LVSAVYAPFPTYSGTLSSDTGGVRGCKFCTSAGMLYVTPMPSPLAPTPLPPYPLGNSFYSFPRIMKGTSLSQVCKPNCDPSGSWASSTMAFITTVPLPASLWFRVLSAFPSPPARCYIFDLRLFLPKDLCSLFPPPPTPDEDLGRFLPSHLHTLLVLVPFVPVSGPSLYYGDQAGSCFFLIKGLSPVLVSLEA